MNEFPGIFKTDFFNGVLSLTKKTWLKLLYAYIIYYVTMLVLGGLFALVAIMGSMDLSFFADMIGNPNPSPEDYNKLLAQLNLLKTTTTEQIKNNIEEHLTQQN